MKWIKSTGSIGLSLLLFLSSFSHSLYAAPLRVISLSPSTTELAYAAGLGDNLIAASAYSDYPPQARKLEQVANWQGINLERIITLKPELILAWRGGNPQRPLEQLAAFGIKIFYSDPITTEQIAQDLERLAEYSPHPEQAKKSATELRQRFANLQQKYATTTPKPAFLQFGTYPLFTASGHTLQSEVLSICGGKNIFANSPVPWPQVSREQILTRKPEIIVISGGQEQVKLIENFWHPQLHAKVITLHEDWFHRAGPRIILAAEQLCQQLNDKDY
ncbi:MULTISPECIES: vitamin B12 ABC transporter substrate-binding protein BtuF [Photorhabdus]|uniref:vitamin B12 ABC transporter substrate-binding protein BtuF n=1 Tax=Photorhabdus TaxID=29487 RepID=UPI000DCDB495|nr:MULTISPECIES: vitamin B12 ABC transporter substrate-binding protein BtuF [Photorhabdus]MCT8342166.1 vitamin B12 ABC transporter substrate-binding protein BtuF [Photorhabdus kleinii]RAX01163.1 vitamin B12 ABC transporter substrate-binding protein BtuF [Photorhabdus sp. S9-53]RAX01660.1 vitamin B12 ABC transporter substrate-binding protein BtuF [Photorhabdus sp. S10-54]RAX05075.1 vitamin B12 ABC transporter substrate-binding protein BtuF [Photorhabdus sp. S8-52]